ncbi:ABC-type multidrug transport system fused ATPase/permease subunit [Actinoplanes lutulentus]|uniref:ABC-type multidrug transport system fused ATPase/permease subunit n=1 Tax=Actinoplanes lutulentus TaxID=1287878 RepID=A0A327Z676_9ACTN|nr:ABC transporter ATP-binding protein [Actinoplanes lutulentus]MBB2948916.1 ABC-type multidrug transport system fused ATPase/permease subunit [Actinoplanes lutulentus]RAK26301.1 ABC-type multidrug transport system fused ATPase/permease subunit [Actinoplanes lutulentus]
MSTPPESRGRSTLPDTRRGSALLAQLAGARANPGPAAVATVTGLINGATMVAGASAIGWSTDHLVVPALAGDAVPASIWWTSAGLVLGISAARWSTIFVRGLSTGRVQYRAQAETRRAVIRRYLSLDPAWHRRHSPGRLLAHAISDVDALWSPMQFAYFAVGMVFMLLLALTELFFRAPVLGLVGLVLVLLVLALNITYQRLLAPRARDTQAARGVVGGVALESIEGGPVVRSLGLTDAEDARFAPGVQRLRAADLRMASISSIFDPLLELLPTAAVLVVLAVAAPRVQQGSLSVGDLVGVVYLLITVAIPLNVISRFLSMLPMSGAGRERVQAVLDSDEVLRHGSRHLEQPSPLRVDLRSTGVTRRHRQILRDADLTLEPGTVTVVVGAVGSGKTTLLDVAGGQIHPTTGTVAFDGVDVRELTAGVVPDAVAVVSQSPFLFAESLRDNLALDRSLPDADLWEALRAAAADDIVRELPDGLDTVVGERGATLSGGQRQRICLARALVRKPRLLVLDDATSALDSRVEQQVLASLADLVADGGPTVLISTNRPGAVAIADRVVLVRAGRIVATGTPSSLLDVEEYRRIVTAYRPADRDEEAAGDARTHVS